MKRAFLGRIGPAVVVAGVITVMACGCATEMSAKYVPQTIGLCDSGEKVNGLEVSIVPNTDRVILGKQVTFVVTISNTGSNGFWVPRDPHLMFIWVYPNGQRDNFVEEYPPSRFFSQNNAIYLKPGESFQKEHTIRTHYFPKTGITEFRAVFYAEENMNPQLKPFWNGKVFSNSYGILIDKPRYGAKGNSPRTASAASATRT